VELFEPIHPKVCDVWIADETVIKFNDVNHWMFDIIDRDSRFLLASYMSPNRGTKQAKILMELASQRAGKIPKKVITDSLRAYLDGIELTFVADTKHIQSSPFSEIDSTNIIERFQATIKERTKVLWGFKSTETAKLILAGFLIHYNYFRPHLALSKMTPAEYTGTKVPVKNWIELVRKVGGTI
jgi:transposase-like protein